MTSARNVILLQVCVTATHLMLDDVGRNEPSSVCADRNCRNENKGTMSRNTQRLEQALCPIDSRYGIECAYNLAVCGRTEQSIDRAVHDKLYQVQCQH